VLAKAIATLTWLCTQCASFMARFPRRHGGWKWRQADRFSGDTNGEGERLMQLASNADLFVAHNAVPEGATGVERRLHMPPSVIGTIAAKAHVKQLVLSHRMLRTLGKEKETQAEIKRRFSGSIAFANDLDCFPVR
jgi:ribonuclease BN (tRNA processing enzyme)